MAAFDAVDRFIKDLKKTLGGVDVVVRDNPATRCYEIRIKDKITNTHISQSVDNSFFSSKDETELTRYLTYISRKITEEIFMNRGKWISKEYEKGMSPPIYGKRATTMFTDEYESIFKDIPFKEVKVEKPKPKKSPYKDIKEFGIF